MSKDINQGAAPVQDTDLDQAAGGMAGDPSQWGVSSFSWGATNQGAAQVYKKGSFDITE